MGNTRARQDTPGFVPVVPPDLKNITKVTDLQKPPYVGNVPADAAGSINKPISGPPATTNKYAPAIDPLPTDMGGTSDDNAVLRGGPIASGSKAGTPGDTSSYAPAVNPLPFGPGTAGNTGEEGEPGGLAGN